MPEQRRRLSPQFKAEAVQMVIETGKPIAVVAREPGGSRSSRNPVVCSRTGLNGPSSRLNGRRASRSLAAAYTERVVSASNGARAPAPATAAAPASTRAGRRRPWSRSWGSPRSDALRPDAAVRTRAAGLRARN